MMGNMGGMMKKVQEMQAKMQEMQKELENKTIEAESGGGMVKVVMNGKQIVQSINIDPSLFSSPNNSSSYFLTSNNAPFKIIKG